MPAHYVKPYVKRGKNDAADAEAICEAVTHRCRTVTVRRHTPYSNRRLHPTIALARRMRSSVEGPPMLRALLTCVALASMGPAAHAEDTAPPKEPEGVYECLQNPNMTGSAWHPVECMRLAPVEDQIASREGQSVVQLDHVDPPNVINSVNVWWKADFRGIGKATDDAAHWFCSDHGGGFACVWDSTKNPEDWRTVNQLRVVGVTNIPSVFWVPKELVQNYQAMKVLFERRAENEARYAKAEALAKTDAPWSYVPAEGGACRPLGHTTPFAFMQSVAAKRHHSSVDWDADILDSDGDQAVVGTNNDTTVPLKDGPVQEYRFYVSAEVCNARLAQTLPDKGITASASDLQHKPVVKWVITDDTQSDKIACHWPNVATGKSPQFLNILKEQGATITEVSTASIPTDDKRMGFEISFAYTLKGHANQISWSDLGNYGCDPKARDRLQLP